MLLVASLSCLIEAEAPWQASSKLRKANHGMISLQHFSQHATDQVLQSIPRTLAVYRQLVQWVGLCCRIPRRTSTDYQHPGIPAANGFFLTFLAILNLRSECHPTITDSGLPGFKCLLGHTLRTSRMVCKISAGQSTTARKPSLKPSKYLADRTADADPKEWTSVLFLSD